MAPTKRRNKAPKKKTQRRGRVRPSLWRERVRADDGTWMVPLAKRRTWSEEMRDTIKEIEREWFYKAIFKSGHWGMGCLRRMPAEMWNKLMDALPRCECGRAVAPIRAKRQGNLKTLSGEPATGYCSDAHRMKSQRRKSRKRSEARRKQDKIEAVAMAESIGQQA